MKSNISKNKMCGNDSRTSKEKLGLGLGNGHFTSFSSIIKTRLNKKGNLKKRYNSTRLRGRGLSSKEGCLPSSGEDPSQPLIIDAKNSNDDLKGRYTTIMFSIYLFIKDRILGLVNLPIPPFTILTPLESLKNYLKGARG